MRDGTDGLRAPAPRIDTHVLRHMLAETSDLLDEAPHYSMESARSVQAAMALTRADWLLLAVHNWITLSLAAGTKETNNGLDKAVDLVGIDHDNLSMALQRFVARVDRLHARARNLDLLTRTPWEAPDEPEQPAEAKILHIFDDPIPSEVKTNAVLENRRRLNLVFGGR